MDRAEEEGLAGQEVAPFETETAEPPPAPAQRRGRTMIPARDRRPAAESIVVRLIATAGIIGIGVAIAAIMGSSNVQSWIVGLAVSVVTVILSAVLWSSRQL